ncbi:FliH/SctL family protein [Paenibacillus aquistagni]|uniref:Flagellar assembly protein FliH n=1 Tax=Paenibacillus aquistagni TaxID=1852522 RepID=A0A1X7IN21_9BACL|nr:FliH/SctL family protein [Paenibacillus aquistagni]SMG16132.1 flagellar assembly protein FliH [Paenibacillus aquistagni]
MSNIIKSSHYIPVEQMRMLEAVRKHQERLIEEEIIPEPKPLTEEDLIAQDKHLAELRSSILQDAQVFAEQQVKEATITAEQLLEKAQEQIQQWWDERRAEDESIREQVKSEAYQEGHLAGTAQAEQDIQAAYESKVRESEELLSQAYTAKDQLIQEAEPFVVTLSCSIAEKIIGTQLTLDPDLVLQMVRKQLARKRESGVITLCVSPQQFSFMNAAREELSLVIDSQAELQIIPDASVKDHGCVIRSSLGSIDARIDTQLEEVKKALLQVAHQQEGEVSDEG